MNKLFVIRNLKSKQILWYWYLIGENDDSSINQL